jgi:low temperature requirement protein LtrA
MSPRNLLRSRHEGGHARVTYVELFFDLVFVFAITQLSHTLLAHLDLAGALHTLLLFLAVWWVWIFTSWVTNWLDPDRTPVRLALLVLMLLGLLLSTSIPEAFGEKGLLFAAAYVSMQVGRSLFVLWALGDSSPGNTRNFQRITIWLGFSAIFWIAGGLMDGEARLMVWIMALGLEYIAPSLGFRVPNLGRSKTGDWDVEGAHLAERCCLFVIIALGESILVTGATFAEAEINPLSVSAFLTAFVGTIAMWWIYFDVGAERSAEHIAKSNDPGKLARQAYTYTHLLVVAGIVVCAVADELVLAHPVGHLEPPAIAAMIGGPALYLAGIGLFKWPVAGNFPLSHIVGLVLLVLLALLVPVASHLEPILLAGLTSTVLVIVAVWETWSLRHTRAALRKH